MLLAKSKWLVALCYNETQRHLKNKGRNGFIQLAAGTKVLCRLEQFAMPVLISVLHWLQSRGTAYRL